MAVQMTTLDKQEKWLRFKEHLGQLKAAVDPRQLLESLGFVVSSHSSGELRSSCIIHGGDNETSFRFNKKINTWVCFSHRCHEQYGNDIIGLIMAIKKLDFSSAVNYLEDLVGDLEESFIQYKREKEMESFIDGTKQQERNKNVNEKSLANYKPFRSNYFIEKGYLKETLDFFEIAGGYIDIDKNNRDIIPIRDEKGVLVAYALRNIIDKEEDHRKYIFTKGFKGDRILYNLFNAKEYIKDKPLIIVEGQKSVWKLHEYGINNVLASFGAYLSNRQINLLYTYALKGVVMFYDNDIAGINGSINACGRLKGKLDSVSVFITEVDENGKGLDPADLDKDTAYNYLKGYF